MTGSPKFERAVAEETLRWSEHRVRIRFAGEYQAGCSCSWRGHKREARAAAEADGAGHTE